MAKNTINAKEGDVIVKNGRKWKVDALEKFRDYQQKYIKDNYTGFTFRFRTEEDKDIIKFLKDRKRCPNAANYVKSLIKEDLKKKKK